MTTQELKRKLSAVFSADVKGYSRLMGEDELLTINTLKKYRNIIATLVNTFGGRVVDSPGDNLLAEFPSVVDAVQCAAEIQKQLKLKNDELPENHRMEFRIGINSGDVIEDGDRIYGDGVNVTARIESLAYGGGICISGTVYDQIGKRLPFGYEYMGEQTVKNIEQPVRVYRVLMAPEAAGKVIGEKKAKPKRWIWIATVTAVLIVVAAVVLIWNLYLGPILTYQKGTSVKKTAISKSEKPSIAVLPFKNLSGNPEQEYFGDGITNDIITDLSKFSQLAVIASNTVFTYKGKSVNVKDVGRDLGVRYVLEGSVQKIGGKVRINAQLIDAATDQHLWAERYDRDLKDLFKLQNELVQTIVSKMAIRIDETERTRAMRKSTDNLQAYDYLLRGWEYFYQNTRGDNKKARLMFERAIEIDPRYASAYSALAWSHLYDFYFGWSMFPNKSLERAYDLAKQALSIEESNASAHSALGSIYLRRTQYDLAKIELRRALELNPNDTLSQNQLGSVMLYSGQKDEAIHWLESALNLNPHLSLGGLMILGQAYYLTGRYGDATTVLKKGIAKNPEYVGYHIMLAAANAQAGHTKEAKHWAVEVFRMDPFFDIDSYGSVFRNPKDREQIINGLRKAGLDERDSN
jgi:adenylate cyclase